MDGWILYSNAFGVEEKTKKIIIDGGNAPPYKLSLNVNTAETKTEK